MALIEPEPAPELAPAETPPSATVAPPPPAIGFRNPGAVRIGMFVGAAVTLLIHLLPLLGGPVLLWMLVLLLAGGFVSVDLYHRRTGDFLSVRSGARLGWITGLFSFLLMMVVFTLNIVALTANGSFERYFRDQMTTRGTPPDVLKQLDAILQSPALLGTMFFIVLAVMFMMLTVVTSVGGALAAKVMEKD